MKRREREMETDGERKGWKERKERKQKSKKKTR